MTTPYATGLQAHHVWRMAGAVVYNVPGGSLVFYAGKVWAVANPGMDSALTHFRQPLAEVSIPVNDWPQSEAEALEMLNDDRLLVGLGNWQQLGLKL